MPQSTSNTIAIDIMRPVSEVFEFTINPDNTPRWINFILEEKKSDDIVKIGTIYRQKLVIGNDIPREGAFIVTEIIPNKKFTMQTLNGTYYCTYIYESINDGTRLTYFEDTGSAETLNDPLGIDSFERLKRIIEGNANGSQV